MNLRGVERLVSSAREKPRAMACLSQNTARKVPRATTNRRPLDQRMLAGLCFHAKAEAIRSRVIRRCDRVGGSVGWPERPTYPPSSGGARRPSASRTSAWLACPGPGRSPATARVRAATAPGRRSELARVGHQHLLGAPGPGGAVLKPRHRRLIYLQYRRDLDLVGPPVPPAPGDRRDRSRAETGAEPPRPPCPLYPRAGRWGTVDRPPCAGVADQNYAPRRTSAFNTV